MIRDLVDIAIDVVGEGLFGGKTRRRENARGQMRPITWCRRKNRSSSTWIR